MSRCSVCDYSQSTDSLYHDSLSISAHSNNRVVYNAKLGRNICIACLETHFAANNYWTAIDGAEEDDVFEVQTDESASEYCGGTKVESD